MVDDSDVYDKLYFNVKAMGTILAPFEAWMALRGAKTLHARVEKAAGNALKVAQFLEKHPKVERVLYPGLKSHPQHKIAQKNKSTSDSSGGSGMLSFYIKGDFYDTKKFLKSLKVFTMAISLGAVESLIESPAHMTHDSVPAEIRKYLGIDDNLCRVSCGLEHSKDLIDDLS